MSAKFIPLDLSKFRRGESPKPGITRLHHQDGHVVDIAHNALSPKMRGHLAALPMHAATIAQKHEMHKEQMMADGGDVQPQPMLSASAPKPQSGDDFDQEKEMQELSKMNYYPGAQKKAEGGPVGPMNPKLTESKKSPADKGPMARAIKKAAVISAVPHSSDEEQDPTQVGKASMYAAESPVVSRQRELMRSMPKQPRRYADGADPVLPAGQDTQDANPQKVNPADVQPSGSLPTATPQAVLQAAENQQQDNMQTAKDGDTQAIDIAGPKAAAISPELQEKRQMYNERMRIPIGKGFAAPPGSTFGPNGEAPKMFSPDTWTQVEQEYTDRQKNKAYDQAQTVIEQQKENAARQAAGLPPVPGVGGQQAPQQGALPQDAQQPQQQQQGDLGMGNDPFGTQKAADIYSRGIGETKAGLASEAQATAELGQKEAQIQADSAKRAWNAQEHYNFERGHLDDVTQAIRDDINNSHINPQRYIQSMTTGGKIASAIGLILGGMGGGLTHQENPAMKFLTYQIDNDVKAQAAELGKKENLLGNYMKQYGNLKDAFDATRMTNQEIISSQLKQLEAQAKDPMAKARLQQAYGKLDMDTAQMQGQMAMRRTLLSGVNGGHIDPAMIVNHMGLPEGQKAAANKELVEAQAMVRGRDNALSAFDQAVKENTVGNRIMNPIQSGKRIDALVGPVVAQLSKETAGRFTEQDAGMLKSLFNTMGGNQKTVAMQRAQLVKLLTEKMGPESFPVIRSLGIDMTGTGRYDNTGRAKIQFSPGAATAAPPRR